MDLDGNLNHNLSIRWDFNEINDVQQKYDFHGAETEKQRLNVKCFYGRFFFLQLTQLNWYVKNIRGTHKFRQNRGETEINFMSII